MLRRIFFLIGTLAGGAAFCVTLWLTLSGGNFDPMQASIRAVGAGIAMLVVSLLLYRLIERLGA